jgi:hypothetical protein
MVEAAVNAVTAVTARVARDSYPRRDNLYSSNNACTRKVSGVVEIISVRTRGI